MTEPKKKKSRALTRIEELLGKKAAEAKLIKEGRWHDVEIEDEETEQERHERIMGNKGAWQ